MQRRKRSRKVSVSVRVMWNEQGPEAKKLFEDVLRTVINALKQKYKVRVSEVYPNRKGVGGRVYISVTKQ